MTPTRRDFFRLAAGTAAVALPVTSSVAAERAAPGDRNWPGPEAGTQAIARKRIPKTGELLPMIGLGTSRTFKVDPKADNANLVEVMQAFLAWGGSLVDSSPMYGTSEEVTGTLLAKLGRDDLFYATKVWTDKGKTAGLEQMEESRRRMGPKRFDLMQVHNLLGLETHMETLQEMKADGRIRYLGVTEMRDYQTVEKLIVADRLDFIQIPYSLGDRKVEARILPAALDHGVAVLVMRPFERGKLFGAFKNRTVPEWAVEFGCHSWAQLLLKFLLGHPAVTCPIPATSKVHHLVDNMAAGVGRLPTATERKKMIDLLQE
jgi:aryl-alcohol dehydrogenase-like predicted oxidoreductase